MSNSKETVQFPGSVFKVSTMADHSMRLWIDTPEMSGDDMTKLFDMKGAQGWVLIAPEPFKAEDIDIPDVQLEFKGDKTPSQRMRAVLYRVWENQSSQKTFEQFYREIMEQLLNQIKEKYLN